jgi:hypothetical protein
MEFKKWLLEVGGQIGEPPLQPASGLNNGALPRYNKSDMPPNWKKEIRKAKRKPSLSDFKYNPKVEL